MDHLNGVFIVDRVSEIERIQYQKDLKELERKSKSLISSDSQSKGVCPLTLLEVKIK